MAVELTLKAKEQGTYVIRYAFLDEAGLAAQPASMAWTLLRDGAQVVNSREDVTLTPDTTVTIILQGDDLALWKQDSRKRRLFLEGLYDSTIGTDLPYTDELLFEVEDLRGVAPVDA